MKLKIKNTLIHVYWNIVYKTFKLFPLKEKVFFESFLGNSFSGTPKYIYDYLRDSDEYTFIHVLSIRNAKTFENLSGIKVVEKTSVKYLYHLATSKYIINNSRMPGGFTKKKNQIYFQTWHGTPLKKLVYDMDDVKLPNISKEKYYKNFTKDVKMWDYLLASNEYSEKIFKRAFKYEGKVINTPYPQIQALLKLEKEDAIKIKEKLNIPQDNKVILYCPTFRDNKYIQKGKYIQEININIKQLKSKLKTSKLTVIIRTHYLVKELRYKYPSAEFVNLSDYSEINDLYYISDLLITDYSSVFFEYMYLNKPIIFYQYDQKEYRDELRDFYIPLENLPGSVVLEEKELYKKVGSEIQKTPLKNNDFLVKYRLGVNEEESLKSIVKNIFITK